MEEEKESPLAPTFHFDDQLLLRKRGLKVYQIVPDGTLAAPICMSLHLTLSKSKAPFICVYVLYVTDYA